MEKKLTDKARRTRAHLLETALRMFADRGYEASTMRAIAVEAHVSTGLAYRYFENKEAMVAELYSQLADAFIAEVELADGPWTDRGLFALDASLRVLAPHRDVLAALTGRGQVSPPLARRSAEIEAVFVRAVTGAKNPPVQAELFGQAFYLGQLGLLLFWTLDRSEGQRATRQLREWVGSVLPAASWALRLPGATRPLARLLAIVRAGVLGEEER